MQISKKIKDSYSNQYDQSMIEWRMIAAKYKAKNIVQLAENLQFKSVLEVGCGEGSILYWLSKWEFSENLNGIEISESGIEIVKSKNIKHLKSIQLFDGYNIPFKNDEIDLVICSHVMEHVEHERVLLREIKRISKYQIFEVPIDFSFYVDKKITHFLAYGHINIYTPALFRFLLKTEKFIPLNDINYLMEKEVIDLLYAKNFRNHILIKIKHFILRLIPYFKGIKPSSYAILTSKNNSDEEITIFDQSKKKL